MKNGIKIMNIEGAEILKDNIDGVIIEREYKCVFANSLLLDELKECKLNINEKEEATADIIMLNFTYGFDCKAINDLKDKINHNKKEIDQLRVINNYLLKWRKNQKGNKNKAKYTETIKMNSDKIKYYKSFNDNIQSRLDSLRYSKNRVRDKLYKDGFHLDFYKKDKEGNSKKDKTIEYCFWFRTPSKSRVGDALFINKDLYEKINKWQTMDIILEEDEYGKVKLVEIQAYKSLTASHVERKVNIPTKGILVVNDLDSYHKTMCAEVYYHIADSLNNPLDTEDMCYVRNNESIVKNTLWDGMMLLDESYFNDDKSFYLLRNHFFKACAFNSKIQQFYKDYCNQHGLDYNTFEVKDKYDNYIPVKSIVGITTENAMKFEKFFTDKKVGYSSWLEHVVADGELFGICKEDHKSKFGDNQKSSYQHVNSLPLNEQKSIELVNTSKEVIESMKDNNELFIDYLIRTATDMNNNMMIVDLYNNNDKFYDTELFRKYKTRKISKLKETLRMVNYFWKQKI